MELVRNIRWSSNFILRIFKLNETKFKIDIYEGRDPVLNVQNRYELLSYTVAIVITILVFLLFDPIRELDFVEILSVLIFLFLIVSILFIFVSTPFYYKIVQDMEKAYFNEYPHSTTTFNIANELNDPTEIINALGVLQIEDTNNVFQEDEILIKSQLEVDYSDQEKLNQDKINYIIFPVFITNNLIIKPLLPMNLIFEWENQVHQLRIKIRFLLTILISHFPQILSRKKYFPEKGQYIPAIKFIEKYPLDNPRDPFYKDLLV